MKRILAVIVLSLCFLACEDSAKKDFLNYSVEKAVINISNDTLSLNGEALPNIYESAMKNDNLLITELDEPLRTKRKTGVKEINIHIDSTEPFKILHKVLATVEFAGYTKFQTTIGNDYKKHWNISLPNFNLWHRTSISKIGQDEKVRNYLALSVEYMQNCPLEHIQGSCWKVGSNDFTDYQYSSDKDIEPLLKVIYDTNLNTTRKDKKDLALRVPDEIPLAAVLPVMKAIDEIGFSIQPTVNTKKIF